MKRTIILIAVIALAVSGAYVVFADEPMGGGMMRGGMMRGGMMNDNQKNQQGMGQQGMMGNMQGRGMKMDNIGSMMNSSSVVATKDGGVIVLMGNELSKYDSNLNLVKQVEIKFDWENWQKMMMQHRNMMMQRRNMMRGGQSNSN